MASTIGSNLDINSIVSQLMTVEKRPLTLLARKEASYQAKLTGFGTLKGALSQFQTAVQNLSNISKFQAVKASVADTTVATISATSSATPGTYSLEVTKLAQAQKLAAAGQTSDTAAIGSGVLTFDFGMITGGALTNGKYTGASFTSNGSGIKTVTIDASNNSLAGIRDAINAAGIGVTATIVNDGGTSPYRLALAVNNLGANNSVKISVAGDAANGGAALTSLLANDPAGSQALSETVTAQNAEFKIDGIAISKASNTVTDALAGITLNLAKATSGSTSITVARDTASVASAVKSFVSAYNDITATLKNLSAYNAETKTAASLNGESAVRTIQTQIRGILSAPVTGGGSAFTVLSEIGVSLQKDGSLAVDDTKLQKALTNNFPDFAGLFAEAAKTTDSLVSFVSSSDKTKPGSYAVNVTQLATRGKTTADGAPTTTITKGVNDTLEVQLDGTTATITLSEGAYADAAALAAEVQSRINGVAAFVTAGSTVKVSVSGGLLSITSERYGSASKINISGGNGQTYLGFAGVTPTDGVDVAGTINGAAATGSGQYLTGATGNASEGIKLKIADGGTGSRGTVNYSQGYASQFHKLAGTLLGTDGLLASRTDGINETLKGFSKEEERINLRLESIEQRYRAQFTALDMLLSKMNTTSTYLTQQLDALANLNG